MNYIFCIIVFLFSTTFIFAAAEDQPPPQMRAKFMDIVYEIEGGALDGKLGYVFSLRSRQQVPVQLTALPGTIDMDVKAVLSAGGIHTNGQPSFVGRTELGEVMFDGTTETLNAVPLPRRNNRPGNIIIVVDNDVRRLEWGFGDKTSRALLRHARLEKLDLGTPDEPTTLGYPDYISVLFGLEMTPVRPEHSSTFTSFTVTPALPEGMALDRSTGVISGIAPDEDGFQSWHTVTAGGVSQEISIVTHVSLAPYDIHQTWDYEIWTSGFDRSSFNSQSLEYSINIDGDNAFNEFYYPETDPDVITVNSEAVDPSRISTSTDKITGPVELDDGPNTIEFRFLDSHGLPLMLTETIWAGSNDLVINLRDENGAFYTAEPVQVTVLAVDDRDITSTQSADLGQAIFSNIPSRTLLVQAITESGLRAFGAAYGGDGSTDIIIRQDGPISDIGNNDFSQGLEGWIASDPNVISLVPHDETRGPDESEDEFDEQDEGSLQISPPSNLGDASGSRARRAAIHRQQKSAHADTRSAPQGVVTHQDTINHDLRLVTSGEGEQSVTRNFLTQIGTTGVKIRYRFITSEIPSGFYGSEFNDAFSVSIKIPSAGLNVSDQSSMNDLSFDAFDEDTGATDWTYVSLVGDLSESEVYIRATVSNVSDDQLDSEIEIDFVEEFSDTVSPALAWNETDGGFDLTYDIHGNAPLSSEIGIDVFFADGTGRADVIGSPIFETAASKGSNPGAHGPQNILGAFLSDAPDTTTHIIAIAGQNDAHIDDVNIGYAWYVSPASVSIGMKDVIKDGLRQAGTPTATITSSVRGPQAQAAAMFDNLTRGNNIALNIQRQLAIYRPPGRAVVRAFETAAQGYTPHQIRGTERARIEQAMLNEIYAQGCPNVSNHCDDPAIVSVVDIPHRSFTTGENGAASMRFQDEVRPRLRDLLSENRVFHLEYVN